MIDFVCDDVLHWAQNYRGPKFHAMLSDYPAGISFMGKSWDTDHGGRDAWIAAMTETTAAMVEHLHPGAHCIVWSLPRVSHWTATALENAGLEIRDCISAVNGSGFPKSHNVSKQLDKRENAVREVIGKTVRVDGRIPANEHSHDFTDKIYGLGIKDSSNRFVTAPATDAARTWSGWGSALKPASEHWIICRKPLAGTIAGNCQEFGSGALNVDAARIGASKNDVNARPNSSRKPNGVNKINDSGIYGKWEPITQEGYGSEFASQGRFPSNFMLSHSPQCEYVGVKRVKVKTSGPNAHRNSDAAIYQPGIGNQGVNEHYDADGLETVHEWICAEGCPVRILGEQSGESKSSRGVRDPNGSMGYHGGASGLPHVVSGHDDIGNASRFFFNADFSLDQQEAIDNAAPFYYCSKASTSQRNAGLDERNPHPTLKNLKLAKYLASLLVPPIEYAPRRLLAPFCGTGSEAIGGAMAGFDEIVAIDSSPEYIEIAKKRAIYWAAQRAKEQPMLLEVA